MTLDLCICPTCGQKVADEPTKLARECLSRVQVEVFDLVRKRPGLTREDIARIIYANRRDGGPEAADRAVGSIVTSLNPKLKTFGMVVRGNKHSGYHLKRVEL